MSQMCVSNSRVNLSRSNWGSARLWVVYPMVRLFGGVSWRVKVAVCFLAIWIW